ncbi:MAG: TetR/AcrR family transcriptional regulator [Caldilineaceae bacterium]|nr:TetR/AcrR family transcriptional regulator [Caldilineaceae bacterium]
MTPKRTDPAERRHALLTAAAQVFRQKGVAAATVSDIAEAAGVAKGTFYLYFDSKDAVINGVVEEMANVMVDAMGAAVEGMTGRAVDRFAALWRIMAARAADPAGWEAARIYHRPENRVIHMQMAERLTARMAPLVAVLVEQGVAESDFTVTDPHLAAWFVLGGAGALEWAYPARADLGPAMTAALEPALRALGYGGVIPGEEEGNHG